MEAGRVFGARILRVGQPLAIPQHCFWLRPGKGGFGLSRLGCPRLSAELTLSLMFHLRKPTATYVSPPRKKRMQQRNHLFTQHFASCPVLHVFFNALVLQPRHTTQTRSQGRPGLRELLTWTHEATPPGLLCRCRKETSVWGPRPDDTGCAPKKPPLSAGYFASYSMGDFCFTSPVYTRATQF